MLKIFLNQWDKNKDALREKLATLPDYFDYKDIVKLAFEEIYNHNLPEHLKTCVLDTGKITVIDDGDYQGTYLFFIPFDCYQPSENDYLLTYAGYGSCGGCDTLLHILDWTTGEERTEDLLKLCKDIITNTIKPYNIGWRYNSEFDTVDY